MAQTDAGLSTDEEPLKDIFASAMKLFDSIEKGSEATNSDPVQLSIKMAITKFEKATNLVSMSGMFSRNENLDELPTETLQYLLLPALLGTLTLKLTHQSRIDLINVAEIYFRDYLQRCKDYGITDLELPPTSANENANMTDKPQNELAKITNLVQTREAKIKRYKEMKELKEKLSSLSEAMASASDEEIKREYFTTLLKNYVNQAFDEISSIEQEKPILDYMAKHAGEPKPKERARAPPLKPVIITRDAVQKAVFGAGYPAIPSMTVEEFYDQRVRDGTFPGSGTNIPHTKIETADNDSDDAEKVRKEVLEETDDPEERERQQNMDEYKDNHRRGWGNRYNRS